MAGFTFVGREAEVSTFLQVLDRPRGELLFVAGAEGTGKSHLLRQLRLEAEQQKRAVVQHCCLGHVLDADLRQYAVLSALAAAHEPLPSGSHLHLAHGRPVRNEDVTPGEAASETDRVVRLVPNPREFFGYLFGEDRRPVTEKLLGFLTVASAHLGADSRLVLFLDLGRAESNHAFPIEAVARRLPEKVKLVIAATGVPEGVAGRDNVTIIPDLPPLGAPEVKRVLEAHLPRSTPADPLVAPLLAQFGGNPLLTDLAAKLLAGSPNAAAALATLPAEPADLCRQLLIRLTDEQRALVESLARVPSGLDAASLHALLDMSEPDVRRVLLHDEVRNVVLTRRTARGDVAAVFHECLADLFRGEKGPEIAPFHKRAATHLLGLAHKDPHNTEALSAHSYHIRMAGDCTQFMQDFSRTLKLKQSLGLLHLLASEYRLLLMWSRGGEAPVNRALCMANLARIVGQLGDHQEAIRHHKEALDTYQKQNDRSGTAMQLGAIAATLCELGHHGEAAKSLQQAMAINESTANKAALASDLASMGMLHERIGHLQDALQAHQQSLDLHRGLRNELDAAVQLGRIAAIHRRLGNRREAVARYQEAWRLNSRSNAVPAAIADLHSLGLVFEELNEMDKAVTCVQQAVELAHSLGDRHAEASHLRILGAMHGKLRQADEAARCILQAVALSRSFGDPGGEVAGLLALANAHRAAGRPADARQPLEQAEALAARLGDAAAAAQARTAIEDIANMPKPNPLPDLDIGPPPADLIPPEPTDMPPGDAGVADILVPTTDDSTSTDATNADLIASLRAQLEEAQREIARLKAEVEQHKQLNEALKEVMAKAMLPR